MTPQYDEFVIRLVIAYYPNENQAKGVRILLHYFGGRQLLYTSLMERLSTLLKSIEDIYLDFTRFGYISFD